MASVSSLRRWLRRSPQPRKLRVDGRKVDVADGGNCWAVTEETVLAMRPTRIEALDSNGTVLRAISLDRDDEDAASTDEPKPAAYEDQLTRLARIISDAHDAGAKRHEAAYAIAFSKFAELVQILSVRLGGLENAWQKAMSATAQAQAERLIAEQLAAASGDGGDPVAPAILAMLGQAAAHASANGAAKNGANGAAKKKGG